MIRRLIRGSLSHGVRSGSMLLKKDYEGGLLATLIQDQEQMRNHDSRNHLPGFVRFNF